MAHLVATPLHAGRVHAPVEGMRAPSPSSSRGRRVGKRAAASPTAAAAGDRGMVMVVGATGRVGSLVVEDLVKRGVPTRCMARDPEGSAARKLAEMGGEVVQGDLVAMGEGELAELLKGCNKVISASGTRRDTKFSDLWTDPADDPSHPYQVSFRGTQKLAGAAKAAGCGRLVKITSRSTAKSPLNPIVVVFNLLGSMTMKWQREAERAIRDSGLEYSIVRPGQIWDGERDPSANHLVLTSRGEATEKGAAEIKVGRRDVAGLLVESAMHPACTSTSLTCLWGKGGDGPHEWGSLLGSAQGDIEPLSDAPHELGVAVYLAGMVGVMSLVARAALG